METPEPLAESEHDALDAPTSRPLVGMAPFSGVGERLTGVVGLVLAVSAFTGWYTGS